MPRAPNKSVIAFRKLTVDMQREIFNDAVAELNVQADALVNMMRQVVPHGLTSNLANSIHKEPGRKETVVVIKAGGATTTVLGRNGKPDYDYARAVEFGTQKIPAHPFFFPSYRLMRKTMRSAMSRKITKTIKRYSAE
jgi:HK97 gp10 family phage protein